MFKSLFDITGVLIQLSILKSIGLVFLILFSLDFILMMVGELQNISDYLKFESFIISLAFSLPKRMYDVVEKDYNLVVWPDDIKYKDINDMIISGMSKAEVQTIISKNTFAKLEALTKLSYYKKC